MMQFKRVVVLCGGISGEREVSLKSGAAVYNALKNLYPTELIELEANELTCPLDPQEDLIFPMIHGDFGEDGQLQYLLEAKGFSYIGCDEQASILCIHKMRSKQLAEQYHLPVLPGISLQVGQALDKKAIEQTLQGTSFVLKPEDKGSSLGVHLCENFSALQQAWQGVRAGNWMIERYVHGREITVGMLQGKALGIVEICPKCGFYDFKNKYTAGACEYLYPAPIDDKITKKLQTVAEQFFKHAHCRDFGRADFVLEPNGDFWLLEMNTIPGMTAQSLLPKSASCVGISFETLLSRLVEGAQSRF